MTKEHKIRIACGGLRGQERAATMLALLQHPERIDEAMLIRMKYPHRNGARKPRPGRTRRDVNISIRLSYPEYVEMKRRAKLSCCTMTELVRRVFWLL